MKIKGRANTPEEKKFIIDKLYYAWLSIPELRLGQLLENAKPLHLDDMFYIEDEILIQNVENLVTKITDIENDGD